MGANINQMSEATLFKCNLLHSKAGRGTPQARIKTLVPTQFSCFQESCFPFSCLNLLVSVSNNTLSFQNQNCYNYIFILSDSNIDNYYLCNCRLKIREKVFSDIRIWTQNAFFILYVIGTETKKSLHNHPSQIFQQQGGVYMRLMKANVWSNSRIPHINTLLT